VGAGGVDPNYSGSYQTYLYSIDDEGNYHYETYYDPTAACCHGGTGGAGKVVITWVANSAPSAPTITGLASGVINTTYTYTFNSTDPESNTLRYGIDWDMNGTVDEYAPALGYVASGVSTSTTHSWSTAGTKTFQVNAQDLDGLSSGWTSKVVTISNPVPTVLLTASPSSVTQGQSSTLTWSSAYATSCTGTNFSTASAVSGSVSVSPTVTTTYSISCTGAGGSASTSKIVTYTCTPSNICSSNTVVNSCTGATVHSCSYQCAAGACVSPPPPSFIVSSSSTGHLQTRPNLVPSGGTTKLYWNVSNVSSCSVTENNSSITDSWTGASSTASGRTSSAITQQTIYRLACTGLDASSINETTTVNVIPVFREI
jgi:hypothetical protein